MATRVVHITVVHSPLDPRITLKECATLAARGYDVYLIAPDDQDRIIDGVRVRAIPRPQHRIQRMTITACRALREAWRLKPDIIHFHDPELIPYALLMRLSGRPVIYDIHEDYTSGIHRKTYIPRLFRTATAWAVGATERLTTRVFYQVIAERYYRRRFPHATPVLNYPILPDPLPAPAFSPTSKRLLYTGNVTEDRGALLHARLASLLPDFEIHFVGRCDTALAAEIRKVAGSAANRVFIHGEGRYVPFSEIRTCYAQGDWMAGLAIFPDNAHYREKELTKFFEYMQAGLPIVCSDFPAWQELIEGRGIGVCVSPTDLNSARQTIVGLCRSPTDLMAMSEAGRRVSMTHYNWSTEGEKLVSLYNGITRAFGGRSH